MKIMNIILMGIGLFSLLLIALPVMAMMKDSLSMKNIYNAKSTTLSNGMEVVVVENHRTPAATHMVWYKVGAGDEVIGDSGLAHYLEHLMFKGTNIVEPGDFSKKVKAWGGNDNEFTSWDYTAYFQTIPKDKLPDVMMMEADRMRNLNFSDESALTERDVIIQERKERTDSNPSAQLSESMRAALFINHPYGRPIIGWDNELKKLTPDAARQFYKRYYAPDNAILVISGDVNAQDIFEKAESIYGIIKASKTPDRSDWPKVPYIYGSSVVTHEHNSIKQPIWRKLYRTASAVDQYDDFLALEVFEKIIGGNTGLLYQSLVVDNALASNVSFYASGIGVSDGTISISAKPLENVTLGQIENAIDAVLQSVSNDGITTDQINNAVQQIQDESVYELDSLTGPAMMLGYQIASGLTLNQAETMTQDLERVTPNDIQNVIRKYLLPDSDHYHAVTGKLLPKND
jgi:zinc protease